MHARINELLNLRDGEPVDAQVASHIAQCTSCAAELHRLSSLRRRMQELPAFDSPAWDRIQERLRAEPNGRSRYVVLAIAASVAALSIVTGLLILNGRAHDNVETARLRTAEPVGSRPPNDLNELMDRSRRLEEMLRVLPERRVVERVTTAATIDTLEQRIQWVDFHLSYAPEAGLSERQAERLWRERVDLMDSLVKVRYAESGYMSF